MNFKKLYQANKNKHPEAYEKAYSAIVIRNLVEKGYDSDKIQSVMNNYLDEPSDENVAAFKKMQEIRKLCKAEAKLEMGEKGV